MITCIQSALSLKRLDCSLWSTADFMDAVKGLLGALGRKGATWADEVGQMGQLVRKTFGFVPKIRPEPVAVQMIRFGIRAIPIVGMVNLFVGMIVAVSMSEMLIQLNAVSRTAQIVAVAVTRELGPLMTGLVMSGFAGAAIAAEIATMNVNEEILALEAGALSPVRFLVLPRIVGVMTMMMCLTLIADVLGMFGGYIVGVFMLDIPSLKYIDINNYSVKWPDIPKGLVKAASFGMIITIVACRQGLKANGGALGVGRATTTAVVHSIVIIIAANLLYAILFNWTLAGP
jgi:phospholipid/cholesterol/gamma-HCH transport system permease protein